MSWMPLAGLTACGFARRRAGPVAHQVNIEADDLQVVLCESFAQGRQAVDEELARGGVFNFQARGHQVGVDGDIELRGTERRWAKAQANVPAFGTDGLKRAGDTLHEANAVDFDFAGGGAAATASGRCTESIHQATAFVRRGRQRFDGMRRGDFGLFHKRRSWRWRVGGRRWA